MAAASAPPQRANVQKAQGDALVAAAAKVEAENAAKSPAQKKAEREKFIAEVKLRNAKAKAAAEASARSGRRP
jgi:hypothetical protein